VAILELVYALRDYIFPFANEFNLKIAAGRQYNSRVICEISRSRGSGSGRRDQPLFYRDIRDMRCAASVKG
jgi:hypothetical protein